jgi:hypothetical protein
MLLMLLLHLLLGQMVLSRAHKRQRARQVMQPHLQASLLWMLQILAPQQLLAQALRCCQRASQTCVL